MATAQTPQAPAPTPWYRRTWAAVVVAAVLALLVGVAAGAASQSSDPKKSSEYAALLAKYGSNRAQLSVADGKLEGLPEAQASLAAAQSKLAGDQAALESQQTTVKVREDAVAKEEGRIAANTVSGDGGTLLVGSDVNPGTYRSTGNTDCYWMLSSDTNGDNILSNNNVTGQAIVTMKAGEYFTSERCGDWIKVG